MARWWGGVLSRGHVAARGRRGLGGAAWVALIERIVRAAWESFSGRVERAACEGKRPNGWLERRGPAADAGGIA